MNSRTKLLSIIPIITLVFFASPAPAFASIGSTLWELVIGFFGMLTGVGGNFLNFGFQEYVEGFGRNFISTGVGAVVDTTWQLVRDLFNLTFIFGLIFLGFKMILRSDESNTRRWLISIILAALFVNFSLFITKSIVELSNILAIVFYNTFNGGDVSGYFAEIMGITTIFGSYSDETSYGFIFGSALVLLIAAFVFAAGGILLMIRYAVLILFMILSPLMFLGWVFPQLQSVSSTYWKSFLSRAFFAPVYMAMLYISAEILRASFQSGAAGLGAGLANGKVTVVAAGGAGVPGSITAAMNSSFAQSFAPFILSSVMLVASLVIAQKMGADGAGAAINMGHKLRRGGQKMVGGIARNTVGRGAELSRRGLDRRVSSMAQGGALSRWTARRLDNTVGAGLRSAENVSIGGSRTLERVRTDNRAQQQRFNQTADAQTRHETIDEQRGIAAAADVSDPGGREARRDAINAIGTQMSRMSNDEVLTMRRELGDEFNSPEILANLTDAHRTAIRDSGELTSQQGRDLNNASEDAAIAESVIAFDQVNSSVAELNNSFTQLSQNMRTMSPERLAGQGFDRLNNARMAVHLSDTNLEQLEQSGSYTADQIQSLRTTRNDARINIANGNMTDFVAADHSDPAVQAQFVENRQRELIRNPREAGSLPVEAFSSSAMRQFLTPQAVEQRLLNPDTTNADRIAIRDNIDDYITSLMINPAEQTRVENQWRNWVNRSPAGASLGLTQV